MNTQGKRLAVLAVGVIAIVVAFVIASSGGSDNNESTGSTARTPTTTGAGSEPVQPVAVVRVKDAKPVGGVQKITVKKGDWVRFKVVSGTADEIHVHGYDLHKDVTAGGSVSFSFRATIDGIFDIELESRGEQIASLEVHD